MYHSDINIQIELFQLLTPAIQILRLSPSQLPSPTSVSPLINVLAPLHDRCTLYKPLTQYSCYIHGMLEDHTRGIHEGLLKLQHAEREVADVVLKSRDSIPAVIEIICSVGGLAS